MCQALLMEGLLMHVLLKETTPGLKKEKNKCYFPYGRCCSMAIKGYAGFEVAALLSREQITPGLKNDKNKRCFPGDRGCSMAINGCAGFEVVALLPRHPMENAYTRPGPCGPAGTVMHGIVG
jgi:hypothetical protein